MGIFENRSLVSSDRLKRLLLFVLFLLSGLMLLVGCHEDQEEEVISSIYNEDDLKYEDSLKQYLRNTYPSVINKLKSDINEFAVRPPSPFLEVNVIGDKC